MTCKLADWSDNRRQQVSDAVGRIEQEGLLSVGSRRYGVTVAERNETPWRESKVADQ